MATTVRNTTIRNLSAEAMAISSNMHREHSSSTHKKVAEAIGHDVTYFAETYNPDGGRGVEIRGWLRSKSRPMSNQVFNLEGTLWRVVECNFEPYEFSFGKYSLHAIKIGVAGLLDLDGTLLSAEEGAAQQEFSSLAATLGCHQVDGITSSFDSSRTRALFIHGYAEDHSRLQIGWGFRFRDTIWTIVEFSTPWEGCGRFSIRAEENVPSTIRMSPGERFEPTPQRRSAPRRSTSPASVVTAPSLDRLPARKIAL